MEYIRDFKNFILEGPSSLTLGKFDGLHRGHKRLVEYITSKKKEGMKAVVFTFDTPPQSIVKKSTQNVLTTNKEKIPIFEQLGVDYVIECPFTDDIMRLKPKAFIEMLKKQINMEYVAIGKDFYFGFQRQGNYELLKSCGETYSYETQVIEKIQYEKREISSTYVREEIIKGNIEKANALLGHHFFVQGKVVYGNQIGRTMEMPTVNILPDKSKMLPPFGVYISQINIDGKIYRGITNVGKKPTIEGENPPSIETHIFDFNEDIYGKEIKVDFLSYIRKERKFDSIQQLKEQLIRDKEIGKNYNIKKL